MYVNKVLNERLREEKKNLEFFENNLKSSDPLTVRQAAGSIPSCSHRIEELEEGIKFLLDTYDNDVWRRVRAVDAANAELKTAR